MSKLRRENQLVKKIAIILFLGLTLSACGSNGDESSDSEGPSGTDTYIGCVLEYSKLRNEGIITATDAEISAECAASTLP